MTKKVIDLTLEQIKQAWNEKADEYNQWDALGGDEKFYLVSKEYDARIKELESAIRRLHFARVISPSNLAATKACLELFKLIGL